MVNDISDTVIGQNGVKGLRPIRIRPGIMDFYANREKYHMEGVSSIVESYHMLQAADPGLKKTAHKIKQFYKPDDDL